jgi:hypothetical protein
MLGVTGDIIICIITWYTEKIVYTLIHTSRLVAGGIDQKYT